MGNDTWQSEISIYGKKILGYRLLYKDSSELAMLELSSIFTQLELG
jgi:hypothetical protein